MNIFVGNLNPETVAEGLKTLFSEFGEVVSAKVIIDNATGQSKGFGFVEMADKNAAIYAIDNLDVSYFEGNILSVKEARQTNNKPGGGFQQGGNRSFKPRSNNFRPGGGRDYGSNSGREYGSNSGRNYGDSGNRDFNSNPNRDYNNSNRDYNSNSNRDYNSNNNNRDYNRNY